MPLMQYDIDNRGEFSTLFKAIRKIILSYPQITEVKNAKQTSYADEYGMVVMIRSKHDKFVLAFGKGAKLKEKFPMLQSSGKIVRHLYCKSIEDLDETLLRKILEESFILNMEAYEMKVLKYGCHRQ
jgi:DNA-binding Lrp family transcriptional regulator